MIPVSGSIRNALIAFFDDRFTKGAVRGEDIDIPLDGLFFGGQELFDRIAKSRFRNPVQ